MTGEIDVRPVNYSRDGSSASRSDISLGDYDKNKSVQLSDPNSFIGYHKKKNKLRDIDHRQSVAWIIHHNQLIFIFIKSLFSMSN